MTFPYFLHLTSLLNCREQCPKKTINNPYFVTLSNAVQHSTEYKKAIKLTLSVASFLFFCILSFPFLGFALRKEKNLFILILVLLIEKFNRKFHKKIIKSALIKVFPVLFSCINATSNGRL